MWMPRYHFDLVDSRTVADPRWQVLADDIMASAVADRLVEELCSVRPELRGKCYAILVVRGRKFTEPSWTNFV